MTIINLVIKTFSKNYRLEFNVVIKLRLFLVPKWHQRDLYFGKNESDFNPNKFMY